MTAFRVTSMEAPHEQEINFGDPSSPVRFASQEDDESKSGRGDPASPLFQVANYISWRNMNLYIDLMEDGQEGKAMIKSPLIHRSQSCTNVQCNSVNRSPQSLRKQKSQKPRQSFLKERKLADSAPKRLTMAGSMMKKVASLRNVFNKPDAPPKRIPKVISIKKDIHWTAATPPRPDKKVVEVTSPTSVMSDRPKLPRQSTSSRRQLKLSLPPLSPSPRQRPRLVRQSSSTRQLTGLMEL